MGYIMFIGSDTSIQERALMEFAMRERGIIGIVADVKSLEYSLQELAASTGKSTVLINEFCRIAEEIKQTIIYDKPQSKFISRPVHNYRKR